MTEKAVLLIVGRGGREHALAWKLSQSPQVARVYVAPGNGGTAHSSGAVSNVLIDEQDFDRLIAFAREQQVRLTVVGPEVPLAAGLVDVFQAAGLPCFGPTQGAARLEASKAFAKSFMVRHHIPTARHATFSDFQAACAYLDHVSPGEPVVIKASGLAAGKGVILPQSPEEAEVALRQIMLERVFGEAGHQVVIEERLVGQEASVLAFSDGRAVVPMPVAQDHKRALDGDQGPNTGGMGAYAPAPLATSTMTKIVTETVLQPAVDGLAAEGTPYVGVLYAGLMISDGQVQVLEFNCRFGDPETQVILPLLDSDLLAVLEACVDGRLEQVPVRWSTGAAATVVMASEGYPGPYERGQEITGIDGAEALPGVAVFHAGTRRSPDGRLVTDGGRVLAVTCAAGDLPGAIDGAYAAIARIHFPGMHFRRDIGARARQAPGSSIHDLD